MLVVTDPLGNAVRLDRSTIHGHIYRRHPELRGKQSAIAEAIRDPDLIARSKKDGQSLLYFRRANELLLLMAVVSPEKEQYTLRTSFYVLNTAKGDPIIWQKKIST